MARRWRAGTVAVAVAVAGEADEEQRRAEHEERFIQHAKQAAPAKPCSGKVEAVFEATRTRRNIQESSRYVDQV